MTESLPLQLLCNIAIDAAREAGQFVQSAAASSINSEFKDAGSSEASQIVTEVDIRSEAIIRERLTPVSEEWGIAFVAEESATTQSAAAAERFRAAYFWCVDPLDGTLAFVQGRPGYAVSIGLLSQSGRSVLGVVYDPVDSTLRYAIEGVGLSREPMLAASDKQQTDVLMVFADTSFKTHENYPAAIKALEACALKFGLRGIRFVYGNGAVKNACLVLEYASACYVKLPKAEEGGGSIWDYAATASIVSEAGGWVSNIHGDPLELNRLESTFMNHQGVLYASNQQIARYLIDAFQ